MGVWLGIENYSLDPSFREPFVVGFRITKALGA
jgi:hypothetical protein